MQDGPTISNLPESHNLTTSTVVINSPAATVTPGSPLVKVLIKYPADWRKDKFFKDGDIKEVSPETADTFIEIGIAMMFEEANEQAAAEEAAANNGGLDDGYNQETNPVEENEEEVIEEEQSPATTEEQSATEVKKGKKGK